MKARSAAVQGGLAGLALVAAYVTWQREPDTATPDSVVALDLGKSDLQAVRIQNPELTLEVQRRDDEVWVHAVPVPKPPPAPPVVPAAALTGDGGTPASADAGMRFEAPVRPQAASDAGVPSAPPKLPPPAPPRDTKGNDLADKLLEKFTPLRASRSLGKQPPEKLKELGLESPKRTLTVVKRGGKETVFKVSDAVPGAGSPYLMAPDGTIYLVPLTLISQLENGQNQLVDRRLHTFKQTELDGVVIKAGDKQRELVQTSTEQGTTRVAPKAKPDKPDDFASNWNDKVWRLQAAEVLGKGETPVAGEPKVEGRIEYLRKGKTMGWVELGRGAGGELYLRTEYSAGWMKSHSRADEVLGEIKKVVEPG
ncbi:MAG TPA: DUF4340 domain-containing protein [Myxococcaceae bacterium]|jgi:hypothetical protein